MLVYDIKLYKTKQLRSMHTKRDNQLPTLSSIQVVVFFLRSSEKYNNKKKTKKTYLALLVRTGKFETKQLLGLISTKLDDRNIKKNLENNTLVRVSLKDYHCIWPGIEPYSIIQRCKKQFIIEINPRYIYQSGIVG